MPNNDYKPLCEGGNSRLFPTPNFPNATPSTNYDGNGSRSTPTPTPPVKK